jgi:membrane-associated protease RseP (regulator of RpoE activity)
MARIPVQIVFGGGRRALRLLVLALLLLGGSGGSAEPAQADPPASGPSARHGWLPPLGLGRGRLGVEIQPMTPELRAFLKAPAERGVLVVRVRPDSPAALAGLAVGDVITDADGEAIARPSDLIARVGRLPDGAALQLSIFRQGEEQSVSVLPDEAQGFGPEDLEEWLGAIGGAPHRREIEQRLEAVEERLRALERQLETSGPTGKST